MMQMKFEDLPKHAGFCTTVRIYDPKWLSLMPGEKMALLSTNPPYCMEAICVFMHVSKLDDIPVDMLKAEHDPECHGRTGLVAMLRRHYSELDIDWSTNVITIGMWVTR